MYKLIKLKISNNESIGLIKIAEMNKTLSKINIESIKEVVAKVKAILLVILPEKEIPQCKSNDLKEMWEEVLLYLDKLNKPLIGVVDGICKDIYLKFAMVCSIRLCTVGTQFIVPPLNEKMIGEFTAEDYLKSAIGPHSRDISIIKSSTFLCGQKAVETRFCNGLIDNNACVKSGIKFIINLLKNRPDYVIESVMKCMNAFKRSIKSESDFGYEQELNQISKLVNRDYEEKYAK